MKTSRPAPIQRFKVFGSVLAAATIALAQGPIVDPALRDSIIREAEVPVLLLLRDQPQAEIMARVRGAAQLRLSVLEGRIAEAVSRRDSRAADAARTGYEAEALRVRQNAFREIHERIDAGQLALVQKLDRLGAPGFQRLTGLNLLSGWLPAAALAELEADPSIAEIALSRKQNIQLNTSVPSIGAPTLWNLGFTGGSESVAVIDTGIRANHPAFRGVDVIPIVSLETGKKDPCFGDAADSATDRQSHGTHVNGIVAGQGVSGSPNNFGVARGIGHLFSLKAGFLTKPVAGRCEAGQGSFYTADWAAAIDFVAQDTPARVINMSLGGAIESDDDIAARLIDFYADTYGLTFAIAAGNEGPGAFTVGTPGIAFNSITVANMDTRATTDKRDDVVAPSSSRGPTIGFRNKPDLAAPGTNIRAADLNSDGPMALTGTSMASPHVAGAAALLRDSGIRDPLTLKALMINSTDPVAAWQSSVGWGFLNLATAQAQRDNVVRDAIAAGRQRYFTGSANGLRAALVWNRRFANSPLDKPRDAAPLNNLDLVLYNRRDNSALARSASRVNNVEVVLSTTPGDYVVKVESNEAQFPGAQGDEPFALALSAAGFTEARGPAPALTCAAPAGVPAGATFTLSCTAVNNGDLDLFRLSATPVLPGGFSGAAAQTFSALAPGRSQTLSWTIRAGNTGGDIRVDGAGAAFDESYPASSNTLTVAVSGAGGGATLTVSQNSFAFSQQIGGALAAPQTLDIVTSAGSPAITATAATNSGGSWLTASLSSSNAPATLTVRPAASAAALASGSYSGTVTIASTAASNSPLVISVRLEIAPQSSSTLTIQNARFAREVQLVDGCPVPAAVTQVNATDPRIFFWFIARGARTGDTPVIEWLRPDNSVYERTPLWSPTADGGYCYAPSLTLSQIPAQQRSGLWRARLLWNNQQVANLPVSIITPPNVTAAVLAGTKSDPGNCNLTPATVYRTTDEVVKACFELDSVHKGDTLVIRFTRPDGTVHGQTSGAPLTEDIDGVYLWQWYGIKGFPVAGFTGDWKVDLLWNGNIIRSLTFRLNPPVSVETVRITSANPGSLGCLDPGSTRSFLPRDATATLWFTVSGAVAGDLAAVEFLSPDGKVFQRSDFDPLESDGNWCFWSWIDVNGDTPSRTFGTWTARVTWNDARVINQTFQILPVDVSGFMVTRATVANSLCSTPVPNGNFLTTDDIARLWFTVDAASAGDTPSVEWRDPAGGLAARSTFSPLSEGGSWCFASTLTIAGQNRVPGTWTVRALWSGVEVGRTTLEISRPGNDAPLQPAAAAASLDDGSAPVAEGLAEGEFRSPNHLSPEASAKARNVRPLGMSRTGLRQSSSGSMEDAAERRMRAARATRGTEESGSGAGKLPRRLLQ